MKILLIDNNSEILDIIEEILKEAFSCKIYKTVSYNEGIQILKGYEIDSCVIDYRLNEKNGMTFASQARHMFPHIKLIICSAFIDHKIEAIGKELDIIDFIQKPFTIQEIIDPFQKIFSELESPTVI